MSKPQVVPVEVQDIDDIKLTGKQRVFVDAYYACNFNATEAARQAGYKGGDNALRTTASRTLANVNVSRAIAIKMQSMLSSMEVSANEILSLLVSHMRGTMADFIDPTTLAIDFKKAEMAKKLHLVKKFKCTTMLRTTPDGNDIQTDTVEFELYDAQSAAVHLGKHLALFSDKTLNINADLSKLSDDQLQKLASGGKL